MKTKKTLSRQLKHQFFYHNKFNLFMAIFASMLLGTLNIILSWLLQQFIDLSAGKNALFSIKELSLVSLAFILFCCASLFLDYIFSPRFTKKAILQYKNFAFEKLTEKGISAFQIESNSSYLSSLTNDVTSIETNYLSKILSLIVKLETFAGALALMLWYSPLMTLIAVGLTILPVIASLLNGSKLAVAEKKVSDQNASFVSTLTDCLAGFSVIKSFKAEKEIFKVFSEENKKLEGKKFSKERIKALVGMIGFLAGITAQIGVFVFCTFFALSGFGLTPGVVIVFVNLMNFVIDPVATLPGILSERKAALLLIDKLSEMIDSTDSFSGKVSISKVSDNIRIENLRFSYEEDKEILKGISYEFEAGKSYAIVGGSGSGKSTLLNLLTASRTNYSGKITYDGIDLNDIDMQSLYDCIGVIQQNVFVFNASINDNVTMFKDFSKEEIDDAIRKAHLTELIKDKGEDYLCGENGTNLSGGEKQRVSIARSLLKKSSVLFVDEATAALDASTAFKVTSDILNLSRTTRIVITHSLEESLLSRFDRILVLKDGVIKESGTFEELINHKDYFYALYTISK